MSDAADPLAPDATAGTIAAAIAAGRTSASAVLEAAFARIDRVDPILNCFTDLTVERAQAEAAAVDAALAAGRPVGPLAGVPVAVKNLFDIAGLATRAGSAIHAAGPPAARDAFLVRRLHQAGAVLVGALNMDEYAYGFTTENAHDGPTRNPHDPARIAGGSSGGSAAAIAGGLVPLTLGTDTNGSIRVPASLCGIWGLKPTYGRLSRQGAFPFVASLDTVGPFARSLDDLARTFDVLQGGDPEDPAQADRPPLAIGRPHSGQPLRWARLGGHFAEGGNPEAVAALDGLAAGLGIERLVELPEAGRARAAAFLITCSEGGALHLANLRRRPHDFDPATRDRLIAGAMSPAGWYVTAQRFRAWFRAQVLPLFAETDILIAPATPCSATRIGEVEAMIGGRTQVVRPNLGVYTQPITFLGLPVLTVPLWPAGFPLPIGVQLIAAPWREDLLFRAAAVIETAGLAVCRTTHPPAPANRAA